MKVYRTHPATERRMKAWAKSVLDSVDRASLGQWAMPEKYMIDYMVYRNAGRVLNRSSTLDVYQRAVYKLIHSSYRSKLRDDFADSTAAHVEWEYWFRQKGFHPLPDMKTDYNKYAYAGKLERVQYIAENPEYHPFFAEGIWNQSDIEYAIRNGIDATLYKAAVG